MKLLQFRGHAAQLGLRLSDGNAGLETSDHIEELPIARIVQSRKV